MRVLLVEDESLVAEAIRDGLRLEAIAADVAGDGDGALQLLSVNASDIAVLDRTGFELGADDYLTKPFELQKLVLRLRALDRRRGQRLGEPQIIATVPGAGYRIDTQRDSQTAGDQRGQSAPG